MNEKLKKLMEKIEAESEMVMEAREVAFLEHLSKTGEFNHDIHDDALVGLAYDAALTLGHTEAEAAALCGDDVSIPRSGFCFVELLAPPGEISPPAAL